MMSFWISLCALNSLLCPNQVPKLLPPAMKLEQGYVFTLVCDSVHGGGLSHCMLGYTDPPNPGTRGRHPPRRRHHPRDQAPPGTRHPPGPGTPQHSACWATSRRYASYWDAILYVAVQVTI